MNMRLAISSVLLFVFSSILLVSFQNCGTQSSNGQVIINTAAPTPAPAYKYQGDVLTLNALTSNFSATGTARCISPSGCTGSVLVSAKMMKVETGGTVVSTTGTCSDFSAGSNTTFDASSGTWMWSYSCDMRTDPILDGKYRIIARAKHKSSGVFIKFAEMDVQVQGGTTVSVPPPTTLAVTNDASGNPIALTWAPPTSGGPYTFDISVLRSGTEVKAITSHSGTSYTISNFALTDGTYTWKLKSRKNSDTSIPVDGPQFILNSAGAQKAPAPTNLQAQIPSPTPPPAYKVRLTWSSVAIVAPETQMQYRLEAVCTANCSAGHESYNRDITTGTNPSQVDIDDIFPGTYSWKLRAVPVGGTRIPSDFANATSSFTISAGAAPVVNADSMQYNSDTKTVSWLDVDVSANNIYYVFVRNTTTGVTYKDGEVAQNQTWYTIGSPATGNYIWKVKTKAYGPYSSDSAFTVEKTFTVSPPPAPSPSPSPSPSICFTNNQSGAIEADGTKIISLTTDTASPVKNLCTIQLNQNSFAAGQTVAAWAWDKASTDPNNVNVQYRLALYDGTNLVWISEPWGVGNEKPFVGKNPNPPDLIRQDIKNQYSCVVGHPGIRHYEVLPHLGSTNTTRTLRLYINGVPGPSKTVNIPTACRNSLPNNTTTNCVTNTDCSVNSVMNMCKNYSDPSGKTRKVCGPGDDELGAPNF